MALNEGLIRAEDAVTFVIAGTVSFRNRKCRLPKPPDHESHGEWACSSGSEFVRVCEVLVKERKKERKNMKSASIVF